MGSLQSLTGIWKIMTVIICLFRKKSQ